MRQGVQGLLCGLIFALPMAGCHRSVRPAQSAESSSQNSSENRAQNQVQSGAVKPYAVKGIIVGTDPARGEVTVDTEAIPGFMDAMTMPYKVKDANVLQDLHPGDHMNGELLVGGESTLLDQIVITAQAQPDYKPQAQFHVPAPGDTVPNFRLTNQSGREISFRQFRGKAVLVTFIYTRCPLSDYCPRMSSNFAAIDKSLQADPAIYRKTRLLSISFDPAYDSPTVLRSYGEAYTGRYTKETFEHWEFAAPSKPDLSKLLEFFDVGATPGANHTFTHSLSTAVIAPDGKVAQWFPTNDWKPEDVLQTLKKAAGGAKG